MEHERLCMTKIPPSRCGMFLPRQPCLLIGPDYRYHPSISHLYMEPCPYLSISSNLRHYFTQHDLALPLYASAGSLLYRSCIFRLPVMPFVTMTTCPFHPFVSNGHFYWLLCLLAL